MSTDWRDFQTFDFGELRLARVRREEQLAFERERPGNVKQVDGARPQTFGMDRGKVCGAGAGGVHVQSHVEQRTTSDQMFESCQRGVAFARDVLAFSGGDRAALMKGALQMSFRTSNACKGTKNSLGDPSRRYSAMVWGESASPVTKRRMKLLSA